MTSIRDQLRSNFPQTLNRSKPVFSALIANDKGTGVIEKELTEVSDYMAEWKDSNNVYSQTDVMLTKSADLFTYLTPFTNETDEGYKKRIKALFVRGGSLKWGTPYNIITTFREYFSLANIYLVENVDDEANNLLNNGDFDDTATSEWTLTDCSFAYEARFSKSTGVLFTAGGTISQDVELTKSENYYLHFFHVGEIQIQVKSIETSKYWNGSDWQDDICTITRTQSEWNDSQCLISTDEDTENITLTFIGAEGSYLDFARLFEYVGYPTFRIIVQNEGSTGKNALALAPDDLDPSEKIKDYTLAGYFDQAYLTGVASGFAQDIYNDLLTYLKAEGVRAYLQTVTKDKTEE